MITTPKTIKVRLTKKVHSYAIGDKRYVPGDVFEIPERLFREDFMQKVTPPPKPTKKTESPKETEEPEEPNEPKTTKKP